MTEIRHNFQETGNKLAVISVSADPSSAPSAAEQGPVNSVSSLTALGMQLARFSASR